jgi:hypothetical protein
MYHRFISTLQRSLLMGSQNDLPRVPRMFSKDIIYDESGYLSHSVAKHT